MIKLRLKRFGKKREASFRLVACNSTSRRDGRPLQELGFYNPRTKETRLDTEALRLRLSQGAQPTDAVRSLLEKGGLIEKTVRSAEVVGKAKQAEARKAGAKQVAKQAAEVKPEEAVEERRQKLQLKKQKPEFFHDRSHRRRSLRIGSTRFRCCSGSSRSW